MTHAAFYDPMAAMKKAVTLAVADLAQEIAERSDK